VIAWEKITITPNADSTKFDFRMNFEEKHWAMGRTRFGEGIPR
jgi:hypothetical protein